MDKPIPEAVRALLADWRDQAKRLRNEVPNLRDGTDKRFATACDADLAADELTAALTAAQQPDHIVDATKMVAQQQGQAVACQHEHRHAEYDCVVCDDCGAIHTDSGKGWPVKNAWFASRALAKQPMQQGGGEMAGMDLEVGDERG